MLSDLKKYYFNRRFKDLKELFNIRVNAIENAIKLAHTEMDRRLQGMNEFREQMNKQESTYYTRNEMEVYKDKIDSDIRQLREYKASLEGKADQRSLMIFGIIAITGLLASIISIVISLIK